MGFAKNGLASSHAGRWLGGPPWAWESTRGHAGGPAAPRWAVGEPPQPAYPAPQATYPAPSQPAYPSPNPPTLHPKRPTLYRPLLDTLRPAAAALSSKPYPRLPDAECQADQSRGFEPLTFTPTLIAKGLTIRYRLASYQQYSKPFNIAPSHTI
jgi:hypothetical protein